MVDELSPPTPPEDSGTGTDTGYVPPDTGGGDPGTGGEIIIDPIVGEISEGSYETPYVYPFSPDLFLYLSDSAKSKILSATNIGVSTAKTIEKSLESIDKLESLTVYLLDETILNSLQPSAQTQPISVLTFATSQYARIIINISQPFSPIGSNANIAIQCDDVIYYVPLNNTYSSRRIVFDNISKEFCANFFVINNTGTAFPSFGNSILVRGL